MRMSGNIKPPGHPVRTGKLMEVFVYFFITGVFMKVQRF